MAKRITRRSVTKATNKVNKTVNSPAARKRNPKPGSVTKSAKNGITTKKPTRKQVSQAVNKINQRGQAKLNALKNANAASKAKKVTSRKLPGRLGKILLSEKLSKKLEKKKDLTQLLITKVKNTAQLLKTKLKKLDTVL